MKTFAIIAKILAALATIAGIVYVIATYGDKIVAWAKSLLAKFGCCGCECDGCECNVDGECTCDCECDDCDCCDCECDECDCDCECDCEECECEAEEAAEEAPAAEEADFEG